MQGNMFCNGNNQRHLGFYRLLDRRRGLVSRDVDGCSIWFQMLNGLLYVSHQSVGVAVRETVRTLRTVGSTGSPRCSPSLPGLTPPTILVPHAMESLASAVA